MRKLFIASILVLTFCAAIFAQANKTSSCPKKQAGERYRTIDQWERDDLVFNLVDALSQCNKDIQERMIGLLRQCDEEYGQRVADGLASGKTESASS